MLILWGSWFHINKGAVKSISSLKENNLLIEKDNAMGFEII